MLNPMSYRDIDRISLRYANDTRLMAFVLSCGTINISLSRTTHKLSGLFTPGITVCFPTSQRSH